MPRMTLSWLTTKPGSPDWTARPWFSTTRRWLTGSRPHQRALLPLLLEMTKRTGSVLCRPNPPPLRNASSTWCTKIFQNCQTGKRNSVRWKQVDSLLHAGNALFLRSILQCDVDWGCVYLLESIPALPPFLAVLQRQFLLDWSSNLRMTLQKKKKKKKNRKCEIHLTPNMSCWLLFMCVLKGKTRRLFTSKFQRYRVVVLFVKSFLQPRSDDYKMHKILSIHTEVPQVTKGFFCWTNVIERKRKTIYLQCCKFDLFWSWATGFWRMLEAQPFPIPSCWQTYIHVPVPRFPEPKSLISPKRFDKFVLFGRPGLIFQSNG